MKKFLLSLAVIVAFLGYAIHQNLEGQEAVNNVGNTSRDHETLNPQITSTPNSSSSNPPGNDQMNSGSMPNSGMMSSYKDGSYTGSTEDVFYGNIQVRATISGGRITNVEFLQYPNDRGTSIMINRQAMPLLQQEVITAQSANVDIISGATDSSQGFIRSLGNALAQAK